MGNETKKWQEKRIWESVNWISVDFFLSLPLCDYALCVPHCLWLCGNIPPIHHNVVYCPLRPSPCTAHVFWLWLIGTRSQSITHTHMHVDTATRMPIQTWNTFELIMFNWMEMMRNKYSERSSDNSRVVGARRAHDSHFLFYCCVLISYARCFRVISLFGIQRSQIDWFWSIFVFLFLFLNTEGNRLLPSYRVSACTANIRDSATVRYVTVTHQCPPLIHTRSMID